MFDRKREVAEGSMYSTRRRKTFHLARAEAVRLGNDYSGHLPSLLVHLRRKFGQPAPLLPGTIVEANRMSQEEGDHRQETRLLPHVAVGDDPLARLDSRLLEESLELAFSRKVP
jgi:hypothetical protein